MNLCKSKAITICDFRSLDLGKYAPPFEMTEEELGEKLQKLLMRHAEMIDADSIEADDFVTLDTASDVPKFNKKAITVRVGKGLFSKALENAIIGFVQGEERTLALPEGEATVRILAIRRRELPQLNDETVRSLGLDGIDSVEALKAQIVSEARAQYVEDMAEAVAVELSNEANEKSTFELDEDELNEVLKEGRDMADDMLASAGLNPETCTDEQVLAVAGRTKQEHYDFLDALSVNGLKSAVLGELLMEHDGDTIRDGEYEKAVKECAEGMGLSEEQAEAVITYPKFLRQRAGNYQFDAIIAFVKEYLERK